MENTLRRWLKIARRGTPAEKIKLLQQILEKNPPDRKVWEENLRFCRDALYQEMLSEADAGKIGDPVAFLEKVVQLDDPAGFCSNLPDGGKELKEKLLCELQKASSLQDYTRLEYGMMIWHELDFGDESAVKGFQLQLDAIKNDGKNRDKIRLLTVEILRMSAGNQSYHLVENYYNLILMNDLQINGEMTDKITDYIAVSKRMEKRQKFRRMILVIGAMVCFCCGMFAFLEEYDKRALSKARSAALMELYNQQNFRQMTDLAALFRKNKPELVTREPLLSTMTLIAEKEREILAGDALFEALLRQAENMPSDEILSELVRLQKDRKQDALFRYNFLKQKIQHEKQQKILSEETEIRKLVIRCNELAVMLEKGKAVSKEEVDEIGRKIRSLPENEYLNHQYSLLKENWKYRRKEAEYRKILEHPESAEALLGVWEDLEFLFPELARQYEKILPHLSLWKEISRTPVWQREQLEDPEQLSSILAGCRIPAQTPAAAELFLLAHPRPAERIREMLHLLGSGFPANGLHQLTFRDAAGNSRTFYFTGIEVERTNFHDRIKTLILYSPGTVHYYRNRGEFYIRTDLPDVPLILETPLSGNGDAPEAVHWRFFKRMREELSTTPAHKLPEILRNYFYQLYALKNVPQEWKTSTLEVLLRYRAELSPSVKQKLLALTPPYDDSSILAEEKEQKKIWINRLCRRLVPAAYWNGKELIPFFPAKELLHIRNGKNGDFLSVPPTPEDPPGTLYFTQL